MSASVVHIVQGPNRRQFGDAMMAGNEVEVEVIWQAAAMTVPPTLTSNFFALMPQTMKRVDDVFELIGTCRDKDMRYKFQGFIVWIDDCPHGVLELTLP